MTDRSAVEAETPQDGGPRSERTRDRILWAAEDVIAELGYSATSLRKIAERAEVPVALVSYHFGTKLELYRAIFRLRVPTIVGQRQTGLEIARLESDLDRRLELVVRALIVPMLSLRNSGHFGAILSREVIEPNNIERGIFAEMFDPVAEMVVAALRECLPTWGDAEIHYAYNTLLGAMMYFMADTGRIVRLSKGAADPDRAEEAAQHLVDILVAGLRHRRRR
ncbi:MAG: CerR family C-terminal domain-containing protein [Rhodobacteraceae bacterium]|nr:CerR family C-terminal domain-containing protein [Paracoccaceae bacterium]